jgi:hypothetical protein
MYVIGYESLLKAQLAVVDMALAGARMLRGVISAG